MPHWVFKKALVATLVAAWPGGSRLVIQSNVGNLAISRLVGQQERRLGYKSKIDRVNSQPFHGDFAAIFSGQFSANSIMIEIKSNSVVISARKHHTNSAREKIVIPFVDLTTSKLLMNQKRIVCSVSRIDPYQWMVKVRMFGWKFTALILNATISSHWWGKWYKGHLRMNLKVNSIVKEPEYRYSQCALCHHLSRVVRILLPS